MQSLLNPGSSYEKQKVNQMEKRQADQLIKANRIKGRTLSNQGPKEKITESDDEFMAQCIEENASYHGRRHETVMYTNQREKTRDLLNVVNFKHIQEGKKLIKSATTAYNRARPANKRSIQAKRHKGKGLFCFKKPPKAEDNQNECTHHQRSHVKNIKRFLFSSRVGDQCKFALAKSSDDKAYL